MTRIKVPLVSVLTLSVALSVPAFGATLVVNSLSDTDDGSCDATHCSLREAWNAANLTPQADEIGFHLRNSSSLVIQLDPSLGGFAATASPVVVDGSEGGRKVKVVAGNHLADSLFVFDGPSESEVRDLAMEGFSLAVHALNGASVAVHDDDFVGNSMAVLLGQPNVFVANGTTAEVAGNRVVDGQTGIASWTATLSAHDNQITGMSDTGIFVVFSIGADVRDNAIDGSGTGVLMVFNVAGLGAAPRVVDNEINASHGPGIVFSQAKGIVIEGNRVASPFPDGWGIVEDVGTSFAARILDNEISGHRGGIVLLDDSGGTVQGNTVRDALVSGGIHNYYGWNTEILDNTITGSVGAGLVIADDSRGDIVRGNYVGLRRDGGRDGNTGVGIYVGQTAVQGTSLGPLLGPELVRVEANVVAYNALGGILVSGDIGAACDQYNADNGTNYICQSLGVPYPASAALLGNSVYANGTTDLGPQIVLLTGSGPNGDADDSFSGQPKPCDGSNAPCNPLDNDFMDPDVGANSLQNHPTWTSVDVQGPNSVVLSGELNSLPGERYRIDFYSSPSPGQARSYLGFGITDPTDASGDVSFSFPVDLPRGMASSHGANYFTMTASRVVCEVGVCPVHPLPYDGLYEPAHEEVQYFGGTSELSDSFRIEQR